MPHEIRFPPGTPLYEYDRNEPKLREYAKMAMESALVILRWGVESRIWMPYVRTPHDLANLLT